MKIFRPFHPIQIIALSFLGLAGCQQVVTSDLPVSGPIVVPTKIEVAEIVPTATPIPTQTAVVVVPTITSVSEATPTATATETRMPDPTPTSEPSPTAESDTTQATATLPGTELFGFSAGEPSWYTVDDDVMGGVSSSDVAIIESDQLYFSGTMSLDNNGGFSSVRSNWQLTDLSGNDGVLLRVSGDGKVYRLRIRTDAAGRGISYNALFKTEADTWTTVFIPFAEMVPTYRGFIMDVGPLDPATIGSFGFMLSDKQPGEFELLVDWMRAVSSADIKVLDQTQDG